MKASFGRKADQRNLLLRNLASAVILYESVTTTEAKGRAIQPIIERLMRLAQSPDTLNARRQLLAYLPDKNAVAKIIEELVPRYGQQTSGFTRRLRLAPRTGDGAPMVIVQLTKTVLLEEKSQEPAKGAKATASKTKPEKAPKE